MEIPRGEYPRPNFVRNDWTSLNGAWKFSFEEPVFDRTIIVPYVYESALSGIGERAFHDTVWYQRNFRIDESYKGKRVILHFGAVDYRCKVYLNNQYIGGHEGGQTPFSFDITETITFGEENIVKVWVHDDHYDMEQPRGKQYWKEEPESIFFMHCVGIWQSVWLEYLPSCHIESVRITPLFDEKAVRFDYRLTGQAEHAFDTELIFNGQSLASITVKTSGSKGSFKILLQDTAKKHWNFYEDLAWSPEHPRLFDVLFRLRKEEEIIDEVRSYFGMRKVSIENGIFLLNNRPYYQKLILDQGYWPTSFITAPSDEAFIEDIRLVKEMGFNGVRKHQKVEDPRFLYHADRLGLLVWGEMSSAYNYSITYAKRIYHEWLEVINRDYNHPSIVVWLPLNESWGIQEIATSKEQQAHTCAMYYMTKSLDTTRVVIDNDGWEHLCGDVWSVHDYEGNPDTFAKHYRSVESLKEFKPAGKEHFVNGSSLEGAPILITEFGGVKYVTKVDESLNDSWGYTTDDSEDAFVNRLRSLFGTLQKTKFVQGYCYTQLTDVATEINGLLTEDRIPKVPVEIIREINDQKH